jgi:hypothetical protein
MCVCEGGLEMESIENQTNVFLASFSEQKFYFHSFIQPFQCGFHQTGPNTYRDMHQTIIIPVSEKISGRETKKILAKRGLQQQVHKCKHDANRLVMFGLRDMTR